MSCHSDTVTRCVTRISHPTTQDVANLVYSRELEASERVRGVEHRTLGFLLSLALLFFFFEFECARDGARE